MKINFITAVFISAISQLALGQGFSITGGITSGGGATAVCRDASRKIVSAQLLDLYEGRVRYGLDVDYNSAPPRDQILRAIARLKVNKFLRAALTEVSAEILSSFQFLPDGVGMKLSTDLGTNQAVVVPDGCELEGVGYYESNGTLKVSKAVYLALSLTDRSAFILHEAVFKLARETADAVDSEASRNLVAVLFTKNYSTEQTESLASHTLFISRAYDNQNLIQEFFTVIDWPQSDNFVLNAAAASEVPKAPNGNLYEIGVECQNYSRKALSPLLNYFPEQPITFNISNASLCKRLRIFQGGPAGVVYQIKSNAKVFYAGPMAKGNTQEILNIAHTVELPDFP